MCKVTAENTPGRSLREAGRHDTKGLRVSFSDTVLTRYIPAEGKGRSVPRHTPTRTRPRYACVAQLEQQRRSESLLPLDVDVTPTSVDDFSINYQSQKNEYSSSRQQRYPQSFYFSQVYLTPNKQFVPLSHESPVDMTFYTFNAKSADSAKVPRRDLLKYSSLVTLITLTFWARFLALFSVASPGHQGTVLKA
ncbi:hypothetical protein CYMTET_55556 [Cymbomonas tetramitiformis]|uniref:Uncharacterized protein n=1 Tax=Cymbomonas tetramitiformis TaxID=36881 RepID=A0AAE0BDX5_9CHLO|nr:hypothetical protein CYMTET_55556 [Cymbomonas tetramitiformis]